MGLQSPAILALFFLAITLASASGVRDDPPHCVPYNFSHSSEEDKLDWWWQGWFVIFDIFCLFVVLFFELVPIEFAMVCSVLMLCATEIIAMEDMTAGFANPGILAVVCLFIVAEGLTATGAIDYFLGKLLGNPKTLGQALIRMMLPCSFVAAWISSTAVVALMIPIVQRWSKKINQPASLLMMPMCYAVHLGGTVTLVGTTTNLVISGLYSKYYCQTMGIFELSRVGLPVAVAGIGCLLLLAPKTLPDAAEYERRTGNAYSAQDEKPGCIEQSINRCMGKENEEQQQGEQPLYTSDFTFDATVPESMDGVSIENAGLRNLHGLFLTTVQRGSSNQAYHAVGPEFVLYSGDRVSFAGVPDNFLHFCHERGLTPVVEGDDHFPTPTASADLLRQSTLEAVVRSSSDLVGKTMREVSFRTRYHAAALGIYRAGEQINPPGSKLGQVTLKIGDILLLVVGDKFNWEDEATKRDLKPRVNAQAARSSDGSIDGTTNGKQHMREGEISSTPTNAITIDNTGNTREYMFSMRVSPNRRLVGVRPLAGLTLDKAGLRSIPGIRIVAVSRGDSTETAVGPDFVLQADDVLWCSGGRDGLSSLRRVPGLEDVDKQQVKQLGVPVQSRRLVEVVVSLNSDLLHKTVKESRFRTRFQAAIVAIQRRDQRVLAKIGDIELEPGDVLILDAGPDFAKRYAQDDNFLVISEVEQSTPPRMDRFYLAAASAIAMIVFTAVTGKDILLFALFACGLMLSTGVLTRERAHKAIDWKIIITVAAAFGLSTAMTNTKVADVIGKAITNLATATHTGEMGVFAVVMIFTEVCCAFITAKAGALLMFPIAMNAGYRLSMNPASMAIALMLGSSDYTTPQGHQTNLMVLSPGAYKFVDYQKLGIPLEVFLNVVQLLCLAYVDYWQINVVIAFLVLFAFVLFDHLFVSGLPLREFFQRSKEADLNDASSPLLGDENEHAQV